MANLPVYILDESLIPLLKQMMHEASLDLKEMGPLKNHSEGTEQDWKCCDRSGDLFYFSTGKMNKNNGLHLKPGTFCLVPGPRARGRKREDIFAAWDRFEAALQTLGVQRMSPV